ncbi:MAG: ABC transporter ATP-binding protein [Proteobacteria bacterium]|nr:ABC transporter ATP-binding protein [Pseudomonadota bacterium]
MNTVEKEKKPILEIEGLRVRFKTRDGIVNAVNDVSFDLYPGESLGIVGESGCGKSISAMSILRLVPCPPGIIEGKRMSFNDIDLLGAKEKRMRQIRGNRISMIFQDPMTCLNPVLTIGKQMGEILQLHRGLKGKPLKDECIRLLEIVGISAAETRLNSYPHQLSGGMRQRVMIAMGISCNPDILLADEPTTALDVTIQDQIIRLLKSLSDELGMAMILITHNFGAVAGSTDRVIVMYAGEIVETASTMNIFHNPLHPYTTALLNSIPSVTEEEQHRLYAIPGNLPNPMNLPKGCSFATRCEHVFDKCRQESPSLRQEGDNHYVSCWRTQP